MDETTKNQLEEQQKPVDNNDKDEGYDDAQYQSRSFLCRCGECGHVRLW